MNSLQMLQDAVHSYHWTLNVYTYPCTVHNHGDKYEDDDNDDDDDDDHNDDDYGGGGGGGGDEKEYHL
jgi:hypothetical protein